MTRKKVLSVTAGMTLASLIVGSASTEAATYTVKKGDSLWKISQQYHTTVSQIKSDNHLTGDIIYPNQKFKVPSNTPKKYKIVSGDTLSAIAKKYGVKVSQLKEWNHLNSDLIYAGDILKINSSSATTSSTANSTANNSTANNTTANSSTANNTAKSAATQKSTAPNGTYQIVKGDTLSGVAQKFGVTVSQLKEWNHLSSDWIVAGSALKVDGPSSAASSSNGSSTQSNQSSGAASSSSNAGSASSQTSGSSSTQSSSSNNSGSTTANGSTSTQSSSQAGSSQSNQSSGTASSSSNAGNSSNESSSSSSASTSSSQANSSRAVSKKVVSSSKSSSYSGSAVAQIAQKYIGAPYKWGGTTPAGFDCSGFVSYVLNEAGKSIGRLDAAGFYSNSYRVSSPQPGDLIFFQGTTNKNGITHVGIYLGGDRFIAANSDGVSVSSYVSNDYWKSHFNSIRRLY
ncbi:LysM peptidoglycan-binding domain-containing protein [Bacillus coagulans]|uniref:C40 family peptidase n=1 Tax=Heyndrickxia coagulans TaxID=1398 RepID=UPI001379063C|nr:peptidoglycan endopeptidase [Heyndrickxia coagulans]NCG68874.1 LysM peptidoglycan-binding domain-containing protein [Heyndrickxia coagulans]